VVVSVAVALMEGFDFVVFLVEGLILSAVGIQLTLAVWWWFVCGGGIWSWKHLIKDFDFF
jgi:hypothetical protein